MSDGKRCSGSIPYGYNRLPEDKQTLVVDPVASQVVKHIFELAAEGLDTSGNRKTANGGKGAYPIGVHPQYHPEQCNRKAEYGCTSWNANTVREIFKPTGISRSYCAEKDHRNELLRPMNAVLPPMRNAFCLRTPTSLSLTANFGSRRTED